MNPISEDEMNGTLMFISIKSKDELARFIIQQGRSIQELNRKLALLYHEMHPVGKKAVPLNKDNN